MLALPLWEPTQRFAWRAPPSNNTGGILSMDVLRNLAREESHQVWRDCTLFIKCTAYFPHAPVSDRLLEVETQLEI